jgi:hypothetical protein
LLVVLVLLCARGMVIEMEHTDSGAFVSVFGEQCGIG